MDLSQDILANNIILIVTSKDRYGLSMSEIQSQIGSSFSKIGYITINKPFNSVMQDIEKNGLDKSRFIFADAITATVQTPPVVDNCMFITSPNALTDLGLAFTSLYSDHGCEVIIFDTISTLIVYQDIGSVTKFVHNLVTKSRVIGKKLVLIALKEDSESLIKDLNMFVDKILEI